MNKIELIKDALVAELERYTRELVKNIKDYNYQNFGPERQESWVLTSKEGRCITSASISHLIYLIKNIRMDEQRGVGVPVDPWACITILRALAIHGDRSNPNFVDTVNMLADQCSMDFDKMTSPI